MTRQLVDIPADTTSVRYQRLGYLDAYDAVLDCDYAFVAYRETDADGSWRVRIRSSQTAGAVFEPAMMQKNARAAGARGEPSFAWGYSFDPSPSDVRCIRFLVHVQDGQPAAIEMFVQLRRADGSADLPVTARFPWPA
jgi:hypothetical protein